LRAVGAEGLGRGFRRVLDEEGDGYDDNDDDEDDDASK
jgi:hypothetical protein